MVLRIGLPAGIPGYFLAEDHFAIDQRRALSIAGAQIEADPAAVQVPSQRCHGFSLTRQAVKLYMFDDHGPPVYALAHELEIERAAARLRIDTTQVCRDTRIAANRDAIAALLPQQEFQQPFGVPLVPSGILAFMRQHRRPKYRRRAVRAFERDAERRGLTALFGLRLERAIPQRCRHEFRIQDWTEFRRNSCQNWHLFQVLHIGTNARYGLFLLAVSPSKTGVRPTLCCQKLRPGYFYLSCTQAFAEARQAIMVRRYLFCIGDSRC